MKVARQSNERPAACAARASHRAMCVLILCALMSLAGVLHPEECRAAQADPPIVQSACEVDYPPFSIVREDGRADGFTVELLREALGKMGREVVFRTGTWGEVRGWLERGEVDALPLVGRTPEREGLFDFTVPYMTMHGAIVVREGTDDVRSLADLRGRRVAVMKGDNAEEFVRREQRDFEIITTTTFTDALHMLSEGRCDAVVIQRLVAVRLLEETGLTNLKIIDRPIQDFEQDFCFAVKDGDSRMLAVLNEGLALAVADGTHRRLHAKWFASLELPSDRPILVGGDHNYPPFEFLDESGHPTGFTVELTRAIARELDMAVRIELGRWEDMVAALRDGRIDALEGMFYSVGRDRELDFSPRYLVIHNVGIVRRGEGPPPTTFEELAGRDLVVQAGDAILDELAERGIEARVTTVETQEEVVRAVAEGRNACGLATRFGATYAVGKNGWRNIEIGDRPFYSADYSYAVRQGNDALLAQFTEGLQLLKDSGEYQRIYEKWLGVYEPNVVYRTVIKYFAIAVGALLLIVAIALLWSRSLRRQVSARTRELRESFERLREREILLQEMGRMAHVGGWALDPATGKVSWTDEVARIHELPPADETDVETGLSFYPGESRAKIELAVKEAVESGTPYDLELRFVTAVGTQKWVRTMGTPVIEDGKVVSVRGSFQDITELKEADEERNRLSQERQLALDAARLGWWRTDATTGICTFDERYGEILSVPGPQCSREQLFGRVHPDDLPELEAAVEAALDPDDPRPYSSEHRIVGPDGEYRWIESHGLGMFEGEGAERRAVGLIGTVEDITQRKRVEDEVLRHRDHLEELVAERTAALQDLNLLTSAILDTAPVGIVVYRADGQCVSANEYAGPLVGATREQVLSQNFRTLASWRESDLIVTAERCLETGEPQHTLISVRTSYGKDVVLETHFARFTSGGAPHLLLLVSDSTDRVRAEAALKRYSIQLEAANKELEAFAYSVSHDLRAPLRSIDGFSQALLEDYADKVDERGQEHLRRVRAGAERMAELIDDLLKLSRITRWDMQRGEVDISDLARSILAAEQQSHPERQVDVVIEDGLVVNGDIRLLRVVMENLLGNAWKFSSRAAGARIEVGRAQNADLKSRNTQLPDNATVYFVRDNGMGFDMAYADKLFGAFQRLHSAAEFEGTGIGLATVQRAILRHGGQVWAEGETGRGATFYFTLE